MALTDDVRATCREIARTARLVRIDEDRMLRAVVAALLQEERVVLPGGERHDLEAVGMARDDVERVGPDGAGRAEDREPLPGGAHPPIRFA